MSILIANGRELYTMLMAFTGAGTYDEATVVGWINLALSELPDIAYPPKSVDFDDVVLGTLEALPTDFISCLGWRIGSVDYELADDIVFTVDDKVDFPEDLTTITMLYNGANTKQAALDTAFTIRPAFRAIIHDYLVFKYYESEGEGDVEEERLSNKYRQSFYTQLQQLTNDFINREAINPVETVDVLHRSRGRQVAEEDYYE